MTNIKQACTILCLSAVLFSGFSASGFTAPEVPSIQAAESCTQVPITDHEFVVEEGQKQILDQTMHLVMNTVVIEGHLITRNAQPGERAAPGLCIEAESITIGPHGILCTGHGLHGLLSHTQQGGSIAEGAAGSHGGTLELHLIDDPATPEPPSLQILPGGLICTGDGGHGGLAFAHERDATSMGITAVGGVGGDAGPLDLYLPPGTTFTAQPGAMVLGSGGDGGSALAIANSLGDRHATGGPGGASRLLLNGVDLQTSGSAGLAWFWDHAPFLAGGSGGQGGHAVVENTPQDDSFSQDQRALFLQAINRQFLTESLLPWVQECQTDSCPLGATPASMGPENLIPQPDEVPIKSGLEGNVEDDEHLSNLTKLVKELANGGGMEVVLTWIQQRLDPAFRCISGEDPRGDTVLGDPLPLPCRMLYSSLLYLFDQLPDEDDLGIERCEDGGIKPICNTPLPNLLGPVSTLVNQIVDLILDSCPEGLSMEQACGVPYCPGGPGNSNPCGHDLGICPEKISTDQACGITYCPGGANEEEVCGVTWCPGGLSGEDVCGTNLDWIESLVLGYASMVLGVGFYAANVALGCSSAFLGALGLDGAGGSDGLDCHTPAETIAGLAGSLSGTVDAALETTTGCMAGASAVLGMDPGSSDPLDCQGYVEYVLGVIESLTQDILSLAETAQEMVDWGTQAGTGCLEGTQAALGLGSAGSSHDPGCQSTLATLEDLPNEFLYDWQGLPERLIKASGNVSTEECEQTLGYYFVYCLLLEVEAYCRDSRIFNGEDWDVPEVFPREIFLCDQSYGYEGRGATSSDGQYQGPPGQGYSGDDGVNGQPSVSPSASAYPVGVGASVGCGDNDKAEDGQSANDMAVPTQGDDSQAQAGEGGFGVLLGGPGGSAFVHGSAGGHGAWGGYGGNGDHSDDFCHELGKPGRGGDGQTGAPSGPGYAEGGRGGDSMVQGGPGGDASAQYGSPGTGGNGGSGGYLDWERNRGDLRCSAQEDDHGYRPKSCEETGDGTIYKFSIRGTMGCRGFRGNIDQIRTKAGGSGEGLLWDNGPPGAATVPMPPSPMPEDGRNGSGDFKVCG